MSKNDFGTQGSMNAGPAAPRDAAPKRSGFHILLESVIEATVRGTGLYAEEIYLDGERLADKAKFTGGVTDEEILGLLRSCSGFRKLVHSISVSVRSQEGDPSPIQFVLKNWGRTNKYESGSRLRISVPSDGAETIIALDDYDWSADDDVLGALSFEFERPGALATASVIFYLNEPYQVPESNPEPPVAFDSEDYRKMVAKSLLQRGNNKRLKAAIEKAKRGEDVTIAYIGGSITHGAGAKPLHKNCYAYQSYERFRQMFGQVGVDHIHFIKAGVGGTPSELGIVRYDRDILRDGTVEPDIVVVEFAVNDAGDETEGNCYESLCLNILSAANRPAVILLFSVFVNDWNLQDRLAPVGRHYDLPMVSVKDAVVDQFRLAKDEGNIISKKQFFYDIYHPTNAGHTVMADCIGYLFEVTDRSEASPEDILIDRPPIIGNDFVGMRLLDRGSGSAIAQIDAGGFAATDTDLQTAEFDDHAYASPLFPHNWMHTGDAGSESFTMTIASKNLILVYKDSGSGEFGSAIVSVDGKQVLDADPRIVNWTHCNAVIVYQENVTREHRVEIKMAPDHENKRFTILGFGYTL
jgi:hypothetical protein